MRPSRQRYLCLITLLGLALSVTSCTDEFYLSESEAAAYATVFGSQENAGLYFDNLQGQRLLVEFDNTTSPPRIRSSNLLQIMRSTELTLLENVNNQVSLDRLNAELQRQMEVWIGGRLQIYTGHNDAGVRLRQLDSVGITFLTDPVFTYHPDRQTIAYDVTVSLTLNGTIEVNALNALLDLLFGVNGTYPLRVEFGSIRLSGEAELQSPFADAGRIRFRLTPQVGTVQVFDRGTTVAPSQVKNGIITLFKQELSTIDEVFYQKYRHFSLARLRLTAPTAQAPSRLEVIYLPQPEAARPTLHAVARASDGFIYHARQTAGAWGNFAKVPFSTLLRSSPQIYSDPALVASGVDQLEMVVTTSAGDLFYAHWQDNAWKTSRAYKAGGTSPLGGYSGTPAVVASAPGQVEVIAQDTYGGLWHLRRLNGVWLTPRAVPLAGYSSMTTPAFRHPVAVQSGNKIVVLFVDGPMRLRAIAFDLESGYWGQPTSIPTQEPIRFAPAAAASGDGYVDVVYVGDSSGQAYHRLLSVQPTKFAGYQTSTGISIHNSEALLYGNVTTTPVLVSSGYRQLELIIRGGTGHLWHNRFIPTAFPTRVMEGRQINPGWRGWERLSGNFFGSVTLSFGAMEEFAAACSPSGKLELLSRVRPSVLDGDTYQFLFHNSWDSERFGRAPWKTVRWRGYEQVNQTRFIGRPALAVADQHFALAFGGAGSGFGPTLHFARLAESSAAQVLYFDSPQMIASPYKIDPAVIPSGPGVTDYLYMATNGVIQHSRILSYGNVSTRSLSMPAGINAWAQLAAVGYGNGYLDLVAVGDNNRLYHWRFQNGFWTPPAQISGHVESAPILAHTGAGQLELFAIGGDLRLYRWTHVGGAWTGWQQVPSDFPVSPTFFGQQSASSWGDGTVDLTVVNDQTRALYHRRIGGVVDAPCPYYSCPPPRTFNHLGGILADKPVLVALSPTSLHVLAVGTDNVIYNNRSYPTTTSLVITSAGDPPIGWTGYGHISFPNLLAGNLAATGPKNLAAVATDQQGRLHLNRFDGERWTGFLPVIGQRPQMQLGPPLFRPAIASHRN